MSDTYIPRMDSHKDIGIILSEDLSYHQSFGACVYTVKPLIIIIIRIRRIVTEGIIDMANSGSNSHPVTICSYIANRSIIKPTKSSDKTLSVYVSGIYSFVFDRPH